MILDNLRNTSLYSGLGQRFTAAFSFLHGVKPDYSGAGRIPVIGDQVFALHVEGPTRPESECLWEAHLRYADIHYQVSGGEAIGYAPVNTLQMIQACAEGGDDVLYSGRGRLISLRQSEFMILFPSDGHMTGVADGVHPTSRKIVLKVLLST